MNRGSIPWHLAAAFAVVAPMFARGQPSVPSPEPRPSTPPDGLPPILLANTDILPRVTVEWPTAAGKQAHFEATRAYSAPGAQEPMGANVASYAALGGYRVERGAGHPKGAVLRVGLYKIDPSKPFFEDIAPVDPVITVRMSGVVMNQPVTPRDGTALAHLKYTADDLVACGLGGSASSLFLTADPAETLRGRINADNGRQGCLDGSEPGDGTVTVTRREDGSVDMEARIPYGLLRHVKDPWQREAPGTFLEPTHFHVEFEVLPDWVARTPGG